MMRALNEHTWESWFLDYLEGNLTVEEILRLKEYVRHRPGRKKELEEAQLVYLREPEIRYKQRERLHREIHDLQEDSFEHYCIAALEGDLDPEEKTSFLRSLEYDASKKATFELYRKTMLPDPKIHYPGKPSLRKYTTRSLVWYRIIPAAAAVAAIFLLWNVLNQPGNNTLPPVRVAEQEISPAGPVSGEQKTRESVALQQETNPEPEPVRSEPPAAIRPKELTAHSISPGQITPVTSRKPIRRLQRERLAKAAAKPFNMPLVIQASLELHPTAQPPPTLTASAGTKPTLWGTISREFRELVDGKGKGEASAEPLKIYEVADAGIRGVNKILGWNMNLETTTNEEGQLKTLAFNSKALSFRTPLKKEE